MHVLRVLFHERETAMGVYGPLVIAIIGGADHPPAVRRAVEQLGHLRKTTHRGELHYLYVATPNAELPSAETRAIASEIGRLADTSTGVHEGEGFRASAIRAVVTGMGMISGVLPEIAGSVHDASEKLARRHPNIGSAGMLRNAIAELRDHAAQRER